VCADESVFGSGSAAGPDATLQTDDASDGSTRVGLIGHGAIGSEVAAALLAGHVPGHRLTAVLTSRSADDIPHGVDTCEQLLDRSDLVVEAAGQQAVHEYAARVVTVGVDLILVSVGALVDPRLRAALDRGPGRVNVSSGAVGGFDALRAAVAEGGLDEVILTTRKAPATVVQPWMSARHRDQLLTADTAVMVFDGTAAEAVVRFPASVNVAATLALATLGFERTRVRVLGDPACLTNQHVIEATGAVGSYRFEFRNRPSPANPRTSALTARAVLRTLRDRNAALTIG
jgi:aspartate dehydrogenase